MTEVQSGRDETFDELQRIAKMLDGLFNDDEAKDRTTGFVLLVFPFNAQEGELTNYISNADRASMLVALKEVVVRFEDRAQDASEARP